MDSSCKNQGSRRVCKLFSGSPLKAVSQISTILWVSRHEFHWFSKSKALEAHLWGEDLKSWGAWGRVWIPHSSGRTLHFFFSQLWVASPGVGFVVRLWTSLFYFNLVFFSFAQCVVVTQTTFRIFKKGNCSICRCRFSGPTGEDEFKIFFHHYLESEPHFSFFVR